MARLIFAALTMALVGCGGGGGGDGSDGLVTIESAGGYKNVVASGGPSLRFLDPKPPGGFIGDPAALVVVREGNERVAYWTTDKSILFVGRIKWRVDMGTSVGVIEGSGTAFAPSMINGGRVEMKFADGSTATPATISAQTTGNAILNGSITLNGNDFDKISIGATFDASLDDASVTLGQVVGNYREEFLDNAPVRPPATITIDAQGNVTGADAGGSFTGKFTIVDPTISLQRLVLDYTPTGGAAVRRYSGIAEPAGPTGGATGPFRIFIMKLVDPTSASQFSLSFVRT